MPRIEMAATAIKRVSGKPGETYQRCTGCERRARDLFWLQHVDTELPLTMPLCADCFQDAAKQIADPATLPA
jgi:hypothetical protein